MVVFNKRKNMPFKKTCSRCKKIITYENPDELKEHFYFKSGYYRNVCKVCERKEHEEKYKIGKYRYYKNKDMKNDNEFLRMGSE